MREIFDVVQSEKQDGEIIEYFTEHGKRNKKTTMLYVTAFRYLLNAKTRSNRLNGKNIGWGVSDTTLDRLRPLVEEWGKEEYARNSSKSGNINPHIADRLRERDQLIELIGQLPDPDDILARWQEFVPDNEWLDPELAPWPGCLYKDEEGEGYSGIFSLLFEHTREDPHWTKFGLDRDPEPTEAGIKALIASGRLPWTTAYEFLYMGKILYLVGMSHWFYQDRVYSACKALGNSGPMIPFPAFVMRPIRDAIRMHLGKGSLPRVSYKLEYLNPTSQARPYNLYFGDQLIASGIDQRENAQDDAVADAVAAVHTEFKERIMHADEPRDIVTMWHGLKSGGQKFIEWLKSLTAADIERGSCRACTSVSGHAVMPEFANHIRNFLEGSPTREPIETETMGQADALTKPRRRTKFSATKMIFQGTVTLQPGETVKVAEFRVGDQSESNLESEQESSSPGPDRPLSEPPQETD